MLFHLTLMLLRKEKVVASFFANPRCGRAGVIAGRESADQGEDRRKEAPAGELIVLSHLTRNPRSASTESS